MKNHTQSETKNTAGADVDDAAGADGDSTAGADGDSTAGADVDDAAGADGDSASFFSRVRRWRLPRQVRAVPVVVVLTVLAVLVGVFAYLYVDANDAKSTMETAATEQDQAAKAASDYTTKSLTYSFQNTDGFFAAVKENASDALIKRYDEVRPTLTQIMQQAQVQASGRVVATSVTDNGDGKYTVMVFAVQKTQNVQNPQPSELPTMLKVIVSKTADGWQIQDYGPAE